MSDNKPLPADIWYWDDESAFKYLILRVEPRPKTDYYYGVVDILCLNTGVLVKDYDWPMETMLWKKLV